MNAVVWTLVGLLAAVLAVLATALFATIARIDQLGGRLDGRIDQLGGRLDARIDQLDGRLDVTNARIDALGATLTADLREIRTAIRDLDDRLVRTGG